MIALVDYGAGNLTSVRKALHALGARVETPAVPVLEGFAGVIVPGVGHFSATSALGPEWRAAIQDFVEKGGALLGICLGMQWLYEGSTEAPTLPGLGLIAGRCTLLENETERGERLKVPHVGWNELEIARLQPGTTTSPASVVPGLGRPTSGSKSRAGADARRALLCGVPDRSFVYFTHSFAAPITVETTAVSAHGRRFAAVVERGRVGGVQFHPEKSGAVGLTILRNFLEMAGLKACATAAPDSRSADTTAVRGGRSADL